MSAPNEKTPRWINHQQLASWRVTLVRRDPLVIQCPVCGVEWRPVRRRSARWWLCNNGCNQQNE